MSKEEPPDEHIERSEEQPETLPDVGQILKRLRAQRGLSLQEVAAQSGLSASFLSAVERGQSDIALQRLARLARVFGHDIGSFLGYSSRQRQPQFIGPDDRFTLDRGPGVRYQGFRVPGLNFELVWAVLEPHTRFVDELTHQGVDIGFAAQGDLVIVYNKADFPLPEGTCAVWSAAYPHAMRNDGDVPAHFLSITTETVF